ncbi:MAG: pyrophosphatase PpaX [Negativicutes bacterium]|nr:pyrophosphatase PpaX [Negativicutes bacterium]
MQYKGVLFDLDGTLLDTTDLILKSFQHTIKVHYNREADLDIARAYFGQPLRAALEVMGPDKVDQLITTYREYNVIHHDRLAKIFTGVADALQRMHNDGVLMAIVTSKTHQTALRGLKLFDLDKYFSVIIGHEQCSHHKPHPEPVQLALAGLGLDAGECLMVGDSPFDIISAKSAGVATVAVRWSDVPWDDVMASQPDHVIETMAELIPLCHEKDVK